MTVPTSTPRRIHTLDLNFLDLAGAIASYLIPHHQGAILIECGPTSTLPNLKAKLNKFGYEPEDITDILLTHIHLDHAGSAGWWGRLGARIHVHPVGAPHLENPEKLLSSARRIYGEMMDTLWGDFLPVPAEKLVIHEDLEEIEIGNQVFRVLDTPGHAYHHFVYLYDDIVFSGDIGGIRLGNLRHLRLPMPPPEFNLELWRASVQRLINEFQKDRFTRIAPTHFGIFDDAGWHLEALNKLLDETESWIEKVMPADPEIETLNEQFLSWTEERSKRDGLSQSDRQIFEAANPSWMSASGIHRYWHKVRTSHP